MNFPKEISHSRYKNNKKLYSEKEIPSLDTITLEDCSKTVSEESSYLKLFRRFEEIRSQSQSPVYIYLKKSFFLIVFIKFEYTIKEITFKIW